MSTQDFKSIARLTADQIAQFKSDGFLVLEGVLDPALCRQRRDEMWEMIQAHLPRMKRDDPSTWVPITEEESAKFQAQRPEGGGEPYFSGGGHRFTIRNGASELMLNLAPRALWRVSEQLLGRGTVVWPAGLDESGYTTGPCFMCDDTVGGLNSHVGHSMGWPSKGAFTTEPALRLPKTGPVWLNGQGTRGLYCTYRIARLMPPITLVPIPTVRATADGGCRCQPTFPMCRRTPAGLPCGPGATSRSGGNSGRLSKLVRSIRTNI